MLGTKTQKCMLPDKWHYLLMGSRECPFWFLKSKKSFTTLEWTNAIPFMNKDVRSPYLDGSNIYSHMVLWHWICVSFFLLRLTQLPCTGTAPQQIILTNYQNISQPSLTTVASMAQDSESENVIGGLTELNIKKHNFNSFHEAIHLSNKKPITLKCQRDIVLI